MFDMIRYGSHNFLSTSHSRICWVQEDGFTTWLYGDFKQYEPNRNEPPCSGKDSSAHWADSVTPSDAMYDLDCFFAITDFYSFPLLYSLQGGIFIKK